MKIKTIFLVLVLFAISIIFLLFSTGAKQNYEFEKDKKVCVPIIMYHSLLNDSKYQNAYTIYPTVFENDIKYLKDNGYKTVTVNDLISFVYKNKSLPEKCIMITFDDGYYNNYYYAFPILKKYNCKAVISPIAYMTQKFTQTQDISINYGHISVDNINEMLQSGLVEIQNHSYNMHQLSPRKGISQKQGESNDDYKQAITTDILQAQNYFKNNNNITPKCFVYPFGEESPQSLNIIKELGFLSTMTCTEKTNFISKDKESLYELGRYRRNEKESTSSFIKRITKTS